MRPLRSFLLLLIFLACFTGLHYYIPVSQYFPPVYDFIPAKLIERIISGDDAPLTDTTGNVSSITITPADSVTTDVSEIISVPHGVLYGFAQ